MDPANCRAGTHHVEEARGHAVVQRFGGEPRDFRRGLVELEFGIVDNERAVAADAHETKFGVDLGEPMPVAAINEAYELARQADVMLVVGSSLVVYPAAEVPLVAVRSGARMIVVNAEPTPFDSFAEVVILGRSGEVLPEIASLING